MSNEMLKYLSGKVQEEINIITDDLARCTDKDHGDYNYACGIVRGLMITNALFVDVAQRMEKEDD